MVVNWTIEEELQLEAQSRSALSHHDENEVRKLCASLIKQNAYYVQVLKQATGHIGELEMSHFLSEHQPQPAQGNVMPLPNARSCNPKGFGNLCLRFLRRAKAVIMGNNIPI